MEKINLSKYFWGMFFLSLGVMIMLHKYSVIYIDFYLWEDLWPAALIFGGVILMVGKNYLKIILIVAFAVFIALIVMGFLNSTFLYDYFENAPFHIRIS